MEDLLFKTKLHKFDILFPGHEYPLCIWYCMKRNCEQVAFALALTEQPNTTSNQPTQTKLRNTLSHYILDLSTLQDLLGRL